MKNETLGKRIKRLREERGMSREDFLTSIEINNLSTISKYENDNQKPELDTAMRIATALGVTLDYLCGLSDIENPASTDFKNSLEFFALLSDRPPSVDVPLVFHNGFSEIQTQFSEYDVVTREYNYAIGFNDDLLANFISEYNKICDIERNNPDGGDDAKALKSKLTEKYIKLFKEKPVETNTVSDNN